MPVSLSPVRREQSSRAAALLSVAVPVGWVPSGKKARPPLEVANLSWPGLAQGTIMRWNDEAMKRDEVRRWFVAVAYQRRHAWGVLGVDVEGSWDAADSL